MSIPMSMVTLPHNFTPGQRLVIQLQTELLEGTYESGTEDRIDLVDIIDRYNNIPVQGKLSFYKPEIVEIHCIEMLGEVTSELEVNAHENRSMPLSQADLDRHNQMSNNFIYIDKPCQIYHDAIKRLKNSENVSVFGLNGSVQETVKIKILVISVTDQIYLFDLFIWQDTTFPSELSEVLRSNSIQKVVHNSRFLKACLWKCHQVELDNIFDTQVADAMIHKKDTGEELDHMRSLSDCLFYRLHLPLGLLAKIADIDEETWESRPLDYYQVTKAAFVGTYLITLHKHLQKLHLLELT